MLQWLIWMATIVALHLQPLRFAALEMMQSKYQKDETLSFAASLAIVMAA